MKPDQIINLFMRVLGNRLLDWGIRKAHAPKPGARQTPQQRSREKATRAAVKRARQAARITRRMR